LHRPSFTLKNGEECRDRRKSSPVQISLLITTYNWPEALDLVLTSVIRQHRMPDEVLVADDGSGEATARVVGGWSDRMPVPIHHVWQEDKGFRAARSRNRAIAAARGDYVIMIDGDMILDASFVADHGAASQPGWFVQGLRVPLTAAATERMLRTSSTVFGPFTPGVRRRHMAARNAWLARAFSRDYVTMRRIKSCNMAFWRSDLIAVNGFEERMIGWGPEDKECAARLLNVGIRGRELRYTALAAHLHHVSRSPGSENPNDALLAATIAHRKTRSELGLDQHLPEFAAGIPIHARPPWQK
jgi:glycosyltransferase involved in cell wall biosynthesis